MVVSIITVTSIKVHLKESNNEKTFVQWTALKSRNSTNVDKYINEDVVDTYNKQLLTIFPNATIYNQNIRTPLNILLPRFIVNGQLNVKLKEYINNSIKSTILTKEEYETQRNLIDTYLVNYNNNLSTLLLSSTNNINTEEIQQKFNYIKLWKLYKTFQQEVLKDVQLEKSQLSGELGVENNQLQQTINTISETLYNTWKDKLIKSNSKVEFEKLLRLNPLEGDRNVDEFFSQRKSAAFNPRRFDVN